MFPRSEFHMSFIPSYVRTSRDQWTPFTKTSESERIMEKKTKAKNFEDDEDEDLLQIAEEWAHIINSNETNEQTKESKKFAWAEITTSFNMQSLRGLQRSVAELQGRYGRLKTAAKKEAAQHKNYSNQTGGGTSFMQFGFTKEQIEGVPQAFDSDASRPTAYYFSKTYVVMMDSIFILINIST